MAGVSLLLTLISLVTFWLVVPLFLLPPLAFFCGYKAYAMRRRQAPRPGLLANILWLMPMILAVAAFVLELYIMNTEYRA